jgi:hypothetical protein
MKKVKHPPVWFGCAKCLYLPRKDADSSNESWNVFDVVPCPLCGVTMGLQFNERVDSKDRK